MRVTYDTLVKLATMKGLEVERMPNDTIEIWKDNDGSATAVCATVSEAYDTIRDYEPGQPL